MLVYETKCDHWDINAPMDYIASHWHWMCRCTRSRNARLTIVFPENSPPRKGIWRGDTYSAASLAKLRMNATRFQISCSVSV
jgi:hypothetical protein